MKYNTIFFLLFIYLYYCLGINLHINRLPNKKKLLFTLKYKNNYHGRILAFFTRHPFSNLMNKEKMLIHKLKHKSVTLDHLKSLESSMFKDNNICIFLDYLKKQNENKQIKIIIALDKNILKENIDKFYSLLPRMKILDNKITLIHRLVTLDSDFVIKHIQDILDFMSEQEYNSFSVYDIFIYLNFDHPDFLNQNRNQIFNLLSNAPQETQWKVIKHLANRLPKEFELNIEKIINIMVTMKDSHKQLNMVNLILKRSSKIGDSGINKIYNTIKKIKNNYKQYQLVQLLSEAFTEYFLCNLDKISKLKFNQQSINTQESPLELIINKIPLDILTIKQIHDTTLAQNCKQNIRKFLKSMTNPIARLLIFLLEADPIILTEDESFIEVRNITDRMKCRNYEEIMKYLPKDIFEIKPDDKLCVICLEKIKSDEKSNWCSENHKNNGFHYRCIREVLKKSKYCPICRKILDL